MMTGNTTVVLLALVVCATLVQVNGRLYLELPPSTKPDKLWPFPHRCWMPHEEYKSCVSGSCREWSCDYLYASWPKWCSKDCWSGCVCKEGYFRNNQGDCVLGYKCSRDIILLRGISKCCFKQTATINDSPVSLISDPT
uniref:Putative similar to chymotrypsin-elastase inhibitor ixodidin n=1 Tax=Rhipicephalus pulchellus TaxID=72859 RepID=L7LSJ6_RHIPC